LHLSERNKHLNHNKELRANAAYRGTPAALADIASRHWPRPMRTKAVVNPQPGHSRPKRVFQTQSGVIDWINDWDPTSGNTTATTKGMLMINHEQYSDRRSWDRSICL
jgi:hypothetical protein